MTSLEKTVSPISLGPWPFCWPPPPIVTFCHYYFQNSYNYFRFHKLCVIFQLLGSGCLYYCDFAGFFFMTEAQHGAALYHCDFGSISSWACGAAAYTSLIFLLFFSLLRHTLWRHSTIVILAQIFIAPAARLSYQCNIGIIFISTFMALYYFVSGSIFFSRLRRGSYFLSRMRI